MFQSVRPVRWFLWLLLLLLRDLGETIVIICDRERGDAFRPDREAVPPDLMRILAPESPSLIVLVEEGIFV